MIQNRPVSLRALLGASAAMALLGTVAYPLAAQRSARPAAPPPRRDPTTASGFSLRQRDGLDIEARDYLGTRESEAAVQKGLKWLADNQSPDGSWPAGQDVGIAGLCAMSFLAAGHQPDRGPYGRVLRSSADYLARNTARTGLIYNPQGSAGGPMYGHGFATLALAELYGQSRRTDLRDKLEPAVDLIIRTQNAEGGWRYQPQAADADISVVICQVMALRAAHNAGVKVPRETIDHAINYVKRCANNYDGGFSYQANGRGSGMARTGAGVLCLIVMGEPECDQVKNGLEYLMNRTPDAPARGEISPGYAWYYCTQAMYQGGGRHWAYWFPKMRDYLVRSQRSDGSWSENHGVPYGTAMALLALQVPSALLPIYQK
jgi:Prenyltransferase and squalene oxidase repeat